jgi:hypothetical protein
LPPLLLSKNAFPNRFARGSTLSSPVPLEDHVYAPFAHPNKRRLWAAPQSVNSFGGINDPVRFMFSGSTEPEAACNSVKICCSAGCSKASAVARVAARSVSLVTSPAVLCPTHVAAPAISAISRSFENENRRTFTEFYRCGYVANRNHAPVGCWVRSSTVSAPMLNQMTQLQYFHYRQ